MRAALIPDQITRVSAPDLTRDLDLLDDEVAKLLDCAREIKSAPGRHSQALADVFTISERFGELRGLKLAFVGDGNNVANSLMLTALRLGVNFSIATPRGYQPHPDVTADARSVAAVSGAALVIGNDPEEAVAGANAVYTDVWTSMGQESEIEQRRRD